MFCSFSFDWHTNCLCFLAFHNTELRHFAKRQPSFHLFCSLSRCIRGSLPACHDWLVLACSDSVSLLHCIIFASIKRVTENVLSQEKLIRNSAAALKHTLRSICIASSGISLGFHSKSWKENWKPLSSLFPFSHPSSLVSATEFNYSHTPI